MEEALELARAKDTKERMAGVERLHHLLESSRKALSSAEVTSLVDCCLDLLKDNNFRVSQGSLQALASAAVLSGDHFKLHFNALVPAVVERLGDGKQPVRDAARRLLLTLMEVILISGTVFVPFWSDFGLNLVILSDVFSLQFCVLFGVFTLQTDLILSLSETLHYLHPVGF